MAFKCYCNSCENETYSYMLSVMLKSNKPLNFYVIFLSNLNFLPSLK